MIVGDFLSVSSIDTVTRLFGEPELMSHESPFGHMVLAYLRYDGLRLDYVQYDKDSPQSTYELRELRMTSPEWSLRLNGTDLHPGMSVERLSPVIQQNIRAGSSASARIRASFVIAKLGTAERMKNGGDLEVARGEARIHVKATDGTVDEVRFYRDL